MINSYASSDDAAVAIAAARAGADVVRTTYGQRLARIDKGAGDFATAADVESEKAILDVIRAARPDDAVLGEEGGQQGAVDALLMPTPATRLVDVDLDPPFPSASGFRAVDLLAHSEFFEYFRPRVVSTTLALAWVAAGKRAAYVTDGGDLSRSVHFAAGIALCRATDCVVTGIDGAPTGAAGRGSWAVPAWVFTELGQAATAARLRWLETELRPLHIARRVLSSVSHVRTCSSSCR